MAVKVRVPTQLMKLKNNLDSNDLSDEKKTK